VAADGVGDGETDELLAAAADDVALQVGGEEQGVDAGRQPGDHGALCAQAARSAAGGLSVGDLEDGRVVDGEQFHRATLRTRRRPHNV
jgi:hypothetical protein